MEMPQTLRIGRIKIYLEICRCYTRRMESKRARIPNYESGSNGPLESDLLLSRDGFHWWDDIH